MRGVFCGYKRPLIIKHSFTPARYHPSINNEKTPQQSLFTSAAAKALPLAKVLELAAYGTSDTAAALGVPISDLRVMDAMSVSVGSTFSTDQVIFQLAKAQGYDTVQLYAQPEPGCGRGSAGWMHEIVSTLGGADFKKWRQYDNYLSKRFRTFDVCATGAFKNVYSKSEAAATRSKRTRYDHGNSFCTHNEKSLVMREVCTNWSLNPPTASLFYIVGNKDCGLSS